MVEFLVKKIIFVYKNSIVFYFSSFHLHEVLVKIFNKLTCFKCRIVRSKSSEFMKDSSRIKDQGNNSSVSAVSIVSGNRSQFVKQFK